MTSKNELQTKSKRGFLGLVPSRMIWMREYISGDIPILTEPIPEISIFMDHHPVIDLGNYWKEIQRIIEFLGYSPQKMRKTFNSRKKKDAADIEEFFIQINRQFGTGGGINFCKKHEFASRNLIYWCYLNAKQTWKLKHGICGEQAVLLLGVLRNLGAQACICRPFRSHFGVLVKVPSQAGYFMLDPSVGRTVKWKETLIRKKLSYPREKHLGSSEYTFEGPITLWEFMYGHKHAVGFRQIEYTQMLTNLGISVHDPQIGLEIEKYWTNKILDPQCSKTEAKKRIKNYRKKRKQFLLGISSKKDTKEILDILKKKFPRIQMRLPFLPRQKLAETLSKAISTDGHEEYTPDKLEDVILKSLQDLFGDE